MKNYGVTFFWIRRNEVDPSQPTQLCSTTRDLLKLDFPHSAKAKSSGMQNFGFLLKIEMVHSWILQISYVRKSFITIFQLPK